MKFNIKKKKNSLEALFFKEFQLNFFSFLLRSFRINTMMKTRLVVKKYTVFAMFVILLFIYLNYTNGKIIIRVTRKQPCFSTHGPIFYFIKPQTSTITKDKFKSKSEKGYLFKCLELLEAKFVESIIMKG